ncbi:DUF3405 domain-containing protein [Aspergillus fumigatus Af293]|uniref:Uncharacterized protein n=1 Tax=Aspergillus fumigatus (strain ATCC MYA-4609 / CBS 101355 / FGSC A1100 / Af293) TaxID=330879 RepID=Q4WV63_ASPFU|nr:conserved hypothetical protein [Aspergillus fumigatus Af293]EAL91513.1 conserved hypothetical protein [Aspergillus fumigatus Af293]
MTQRFTEHGVFGKEGSVRAEVPEIEISIVQTPKTWYFPFPMYGSYDALGLDGFSCMDRYTRFGAYGYSGTDSQLQGARPLPPVDWKKVNWRTLQEECFERNSDRYESAQQSLSMHSLPLTSPRSAVILRAWHDMPWTENMKHYVRSPVMELSLHTGSEYQVFILTHVKDNNIPIYAVNGDDNAQRLKEKYMPKEFHDMTILFNDHTLESWYPAIEEHRPQYQHLQPLQIFSQVFSDFDYYWQLEMDSRISGHSYHFFEKAADFSRNQPRKYLWERNAYFYIPGAHGPRPPVAHPRDDHYEWGVGEEADLMLFLPIFDPIDTKWTYPTMIWNLSERDPRRAAPITMGRYSKTLMDAIHSAQVGQGIGLASEMTAPSFALWHGLKAVQVPHPIYSDGKWTPKELNRIVNKGSPEKMNGGPDSIWNWNHEYDHILFRTSYMFNTQTAEDLYRRWLGYVVDPHQYTDGSYTLRDVTGLTTAIWKVLARYCFLLDEDLTPLSSERICTADFAFQICFSIPLRTLRQGKVARWLFRSKYSTRRRTEWSKILTDHIIISQH